MSTTDDRFMKGANFKRIHNIIIKNLEGKLKGFKSNSNMRVVHTSSTVLTLDTNQKDLATPKVPRGLRSLPVASGLSPSSTGDMADLQCDAAAIERWWTEPRWKHTKRTFSGECYHLSY